MVTKDKIIETLKECYDPEIPINVIDLGLIYDIRIEDDIVHIKMTLTSPHCPLANFLAEDIKQKIEKINGVKKAEVEIVWDPPWTPERISQEAKETL